MEQTIKATFDGEVFRPDEKVDLEPNTRVKITVVKPKKLKLVEMPKKGTDKSYSALDYMKSLELDGPNDFSKNLDEYLYGGKSLDDAK